MKSLTIAACCVAAVLAARSYSEERTNSAPPIGTVRLNVGISNAVISPGSTLALTAEIKNNSTNTVVVATSYESLNEYTVSLSGSAGNERVLRPAPGVRILDSSTREIGSGGVYRSEIRFQLPNEFGPGRYKLKVRKWIFIRGDGKLIKYGDEPILSNLLEVQVE